MERRGGAVPITSSVAGVAALAAAALAATLLAAAPAAANGRYPAANAILPPSAARRDASLAAVRTTFGVLLSPDGGATWRWLCENALGVPAASVEDPSVGLTADDSLVVGLVEGLEVSSDTGCDFACVGGPLAGQSIVDLVVRPEAPDVVLALKSSYAIGGDAASGAGPAMDTAVFESADDGASWAPIGVPLDPSVLVTTIEVAASDPERIYVSGTRGFGAARTAWLLVSTDGAATWTERPVPFDPATEVSIYVGAVDPGDADRVYLRSNGSSGARLFVTGDAGRSFAIPLALSGPMLGFALSPDGSKVYAGGQEDGLYVGAAAAGDAGLSFRKTSSIPILCLATQGSELWACSDDQPGRFVAGVSSDDGATFTAKLHMNGVAASVACSPAAPGAPLACDVDANASQCGGAAFAALCTTLGGCAGHDAGPAAAAPDADAPADASTGDVVALRSPACRCSIPGRAGGGGAAAPAIALLSAAAAWRRPRRGRAARRD